MTRKVEDGDIGCPKIKKFKISELKPAQYNPRIKAKKVKK